MSNLLAARSPPAGPPLLPVLALVGLTLTLPQQQPVLTRNPNDWACGCLPNPGTFEECHQKCKELFPFQMEGVKLTVSKGLSKHFQVNHTVAFSTIGEFNYHFQVMNVQIKQLSPIDAFPVLVGDQDSDPLQLGVEYEASTRIQDTSVSFRYQLDLPKANLLSKGSMDSNQIVGATLEKKLSPLPLRLAPRAFLNHRKNKFQCGYGLPFG
uniref:Uncharacterized protein n=1 Tax=Otolemur garnettii TaxID=30611 RepID=H0XLM2_OTOGA